MISEQATDFVKSWLKYVGLPFHVELYEKIEHKNAMHFGLATTLEFKDKSIQDTFKDLFFNVQESMLASENVRKEIDAHTKPLHEKIEKLELLLKAQDKDLAELWKYKAFVEVQYVLNHNKPVRELEINL